MIELSNATCPEQHRTKLVIQRPRHGRGMTLVEMLVAMAASLIMLALVAQLMAMFSKGMNASRKGLRSMNLYVRQQNGSSRTFLG